MYLKICEIFQDVPLNLVFIIIIAFLISFIYNLIYNVSDYGYLNIVYNSILFLVLIYLLVILCFHRPNFTS